MAEIKSASRSWEHIETDVLVKIFKKLNMFDLISVALVCHVWRSACSDSLLWNTLDLSLLKSNFMQTSARPYVWVDAKSDGKLRKDLRIAMMLSRGAVSCLVFHFNLYMKDEHLGFIAERCPNLKRLAMPAWNRITTNGMCCALRKWKHLESLTMSSTVHPSIMKEIRDSCKNFSHLKIMGTFNVDLAISIATNLPNLRVLSLRCSILVREALLLILDGMGHLETLNISHCLLLNTQTTTSSFSAGKKSISRELDGSIRGKAARLREFFHCQSASCVTCERMGADLGLMRWYQCEDPFWREDEVSSLALGDYGKLFAEGCLDLLF